MIKRHGGVFDFLAFVVDPDSLKESREFSEIDREFARISVSVLHEMGGKYCDWADRLVEYLEGVEEDIEVVIPDSKRFMMGTEDEDIKEFVHEVIINYDFEMSKYPVTVGEFRKFVEDTNYKTEAEIGDGSFIWKGYKYYKYKDAYWDNPYFEQTDIHPVSCISWNDAKNYILWLNNKTGENYRLPSEAEWEFACRAGSTTKWYFGNNEQELNNHAWYGNTSKSRTHPVKQKKANLFSLYDMYGNVWEWCIDDYEKDYLKIPSNGRAYINKNEKRRKILRGGSWNRIIKYNTSSYRNYLSPPDRNTNSVGFRLVKDINKTLSSQSQMIKILNSLSIDTIKIPNKNYEMGKYPITIAEYMHFVKDTDSHYPKYHEAINLGKNAPIIGVNWYDAIAYCEWLSSKTNKNYRLPTEEEWEYSCRAETTTKWSFGNDENKFSEYAWYSENSNKTIHPVGEKLPNYWGLYDMHGSVWEWCDDWYNEEKNRRVVRGGSWNNNTYDARSSYRNKGNPYTHNPDRGFRIVLELANSNRFYKREIEHEFDKGGGVTMGNAVDIVKNIFSSLFQR